MTSPTDLVVLTTSTDRAMLEELSSPSSSARARTALQAGELRMQSCEQRLRELLGDASPFVFAHGTKLVIAEVRFTVLEALQTMFHNQKRTPDFGTVTVRKAMPVDEAIERASHLGDHERRRVAEAVEATLRDHVVPAPDDEPALRAYAMLQALGLVEYRHEQVDPHTYSTPLQEEVRRSQLVRARPRPHLRIADLADPTRTFGFVYRDPRKLWAVDFAEGVQSSYVREHAVAVLSSARDGKLHRVRVDADGRTVRNPDNTGAFEGEVELMGDDLLGVLQTVRAYFEREYTTEIVT